MKALIIIPTLLAGLASTPALLAQQTSDDYEARIAELEAQVARLSQRDTDWVTEARAEEMRSVVRDVLDDAETRTSLLQNASTAGWDDGFFLASSDGNFRLNMHGQLQFRWIYNHQDNSPTDDNRSGFENARTKLIFSGHVFDPSWVYKIEGNFSNNGGAFGLQDAYVGKVIGDSGWIILAGQMKVPMLREELVDSAYQLVLERSLVNQEFSAGRTQGIAADWRNDQFHVTAAFSDGHPATGGFNTPWNAYNTEYSFTARGEWLIGGTWEQFNELTSPPGSEPGWMVGAAVHYQGGEFGNDTVETDVTQLTVDASGEYDGWNIFGYYVWRQIDDQVTTVDQQGFVVQGGYYLTEDWELYGRYEWGDDDSSADDLSVITIGANRYFAGQQIKWTTDVGFALNEVSNTWGDSTVMGSGLGTNAALTGWRTDSTGEDGQFVFRTQIQLLF